MGDAEDLEMLEKKLAETRHGLQQIDEEIDSVKRQHAAVPEGPEQNHERSRLKARFDELVDARGRGRHQEWLVEEVITSTRYNQVVHARTPEFRRSTESSAIRIQKATLAVASGIAGMVYALVLAGRVPPGLAESARATLTLAGSILVANLVQYVALLLYDASLLRHGLKGIDDSRVPVWKTPGSERFAYLLVRRPQFYTVVTVVLAIIQLVLVAVAAWHAKELLGDVVEAAWE
jgi:hypothetical protein